MSTLTRASKRPLNSGYEIPVFGFGARLSPYSARKYGSEASCGEALAQSGVSRGDVFVTSKVFKGGYNETKGAIDCGLRESGLEYFDLDLNHSPYGGPDARKGAWLALVEAKRDGKIRSMGVSNYGTHHLQGTEEYIAELEKKLGKGNGGEISVGQWELHPWLCRPDIVEWCHSRGIAIQAYSPLVRGRRFEDPTLKRLAENYDQSGAQILLGWSLQKGWFVIKGFIPLPKSGTPTRISANADVFDFELSSEDMELLTTTEYAPCGWDPTMTPVDE
ncbi:aldo-keto reductase [Aspergillus pseudoustus]|uniref:D-xylose reductase [NAD(P)H] n=1 Tax=Aspergillus pseudoustus TaxID=1810923 RepID=A0ABR4J3S0_9EURO